MGLFDFMRDKVFTTPEDENEEQGTAVETVDEEPIGPAPTRGGESPAKPAGNTVNIHNIHATAQLQVVLVKPERFENASEL